MRELFKAESTRGFRLVALAMRAAGRGDRMRSPSGCVTLSGSFHAGKPREAEYDSHACAIVFVAHHQQEFISRVPRGKAVRIDTLAIPPQIRSPRVVRPRGKRKKGED